MWNAVPIDRRGQRVLREPAHNVPIDRPATTRTEKKKKRSNDKPANSR